MLTVVSPSSSAFSPLQLRQAGINERQLPVLLLPVLVAKEKPPRATSLSLFNGAGEMETSDHSERQVAVVIGSSGWLAALSFGARVLQNANLRCCD